MTWKTNAFPIKQHMRWTPTGFKKKEKKTVDPMLGVGVIEPSTSDGTPSISVQKGQLRAPLPGFLGAQQCDSQRCLSSSPSEWRLYSLAVMVYHLWSTQARHIILTVLLSSPAQWYSVSWLEQCLTAPAQMDKSSTTIHWCWISFTATWAKNENKMITCLC